MVIRGFDIKFDLRNQSHKLAPLLFVVLLFSSCLVSVFGSVSFFVSGVDVSVVDQDTLRAAVVGAPSGLGLSFVIALNANISITGSLVIPVDKNITLTNANGGNYRLVGVSNNVDTIVVNGALTLDGITVTHLTGVKGGCGVHVFRGGTLVMLSGEVSGNSDGGVYNEGTFEMYSGGVITNNVASRGGGVFNEGQFRMFGGAIFNNTADRGGGVHNFISFSMHGGKITNNTATDVGGGIFNVWVGGISMLGGEITNNVALGGAGGGVFNSGATFSMHSGEISYNRAATEGGGVYSTGEFYMLNGVISGNSAVSGGGIYVGNDFILRSVCKLSGGVISNNRASGNGGGVWVSDDCSYLERLFVSDGVIFSNNIASAAYNRAAVFDDRYNSQIGSKVTWTSPFTQGYNNYDISYVYGASLTQYTVTVRDSYASSTGAGSYSAGTSVTINAGTCNGYTFSGWTINEGTVTLSNSATITATFTMPTNNLVITANWNSTSTNETIPDNPTTNTPTTPPPNTPISCPAPNNPTHNSGGGGENIFTTPSNKGNLLMWSFRNILLLGGCIVLISAVTAIVLLHKKRKT